MIVSYMFEKSYVPMSLTINHLLLYFYLANYVILLFLYHHVGDSFSFLFIYYTCTLHFHTKGNDQIVKSTKQANSMQNCLIHWLCLKT